MRRLYWPIILFQLVWFNLVVPGHTRGVITIPGGQQSIAGRNTACCTPGTSNHHQPGAPSPQQQRHCAICYVAATYTVPIVFNINLRPAEHVEILDAMAVAQVVSLDYPAPYWPVGPPGLV